MSLQFPATYNIEIFQGSYFFRQFVYKVGEPAVPYDLTGCTARAQIRASFNTPILASFNCAITDPTNGVIQIDMDATTTASIQSLKGVWDLEIVPPLGETRVFRLVMGSVLVSREVTKDIP